MEQSADTDCVGLFPTLPVRDLTASVEWYQRKLGFKLRFFFGDPPTHGAVELGQATVHFFTGTPVPEGHWLYFQVEDVDQFYERVTGNGVNPVDVPTDQPWAMREFNLHDPDGYHLRFGAACIHAGTPVPVERVDLNVPLEKRLAALLSDLALHKKMSMSELLEETLLHSFETEPQMIGRWVASPHTARNLRFVDELKLKHGIDYDTHDAYRFVEKTEED